MFSAAARFGADDGRARLAMAQSVLDGWIDTRGRHCESQTNQGSVAPALHDRLAIVIGGGIVCERGAREFPYQCDVRRHGGGIVAEYSAQHRGTDAGTLRHRDAQLRAGAAVFVTHGGNPGGAPGFDRDVAPELPHGRDAGKQPGGARAGVNYVAHIAGIVFPVPLELANRSPEHPSDHVIPPVPTRRRGRVPECDMTAGAG
jgi:hypothetical protein